MEGSEYRDDTDHRSHERRETKEETEDPEEAMKRVAKEFRAKWEVEEDPEDQMSRVAREVREKWDQDEQAEEAMDRLAKELREKWDKEDPERCVKDAVSDLEEEEADLQRIRERMKEASENEEEREEASVKDAVRELAEEDDDLQRIRERMEEASENKEEREEASVKDAVRELAEEDEDIQRIRERMEEASENNEERVRDSIKELAEEDAELQRLEEQMDEQRQEKEDRLEQNREDRAENAEKDTLDEFEKDIIENFEKYGYDEDKVRELWRKQFEDDVEDELKGEHEEKEEEETEGEQQSGKTAESYSTYEDGSGMAYAVKNESREQTEASSKTETEEQVEKKLEEPTQEDTEEQTQTRKITRPEHREGEKETIDDVQPDASEKTKKRQTTETSELDKESAESPEHTKKKVREGEQKENTVTEESEEDVGHEHRSPSETEESSERTKASVETTEHPGQATESQETTEVPDVSTEEKTESSSSISDVTQHESEERTEDTSDEEQIEDEEVQETTVQSFRNTRGSMFESAAERAWREEIESYYENLPEEEKEAFRSYIREQLKTKEDLERLIQELGLGWLENEENTEKAEKYLRLKQEVQERGEGELEKIAEELELAKELAKDWLENKSRPKLINSILHRLGERTWDAIVRMKMHLSKPQSMKEVMDFIEKNPDLLKEPFFEQKLKDVETWVEIMDMKRKGELNTIIDVDGKEKFNLSEIRELSLKYGVSEDVVLDWLRYLSQPFLIDEIVRENLVTPNEGHEQLSSKQQPEKTRKGTYAVRINNPSFSQVEIESYEGLVAFIEEFCPGLKIQKSYPKNITSAKQYFELLKQVNAHTEISRFELREIANGLGISVKKAVKWILCAARPIIFSFIEYALKSKENAVRLQRRLGRFRSANDVKRELLKMDLDSALQLSKKATRKWAHLEKYYQFLSYLNIGMLKKEIARQLQLRISTLDSWLIGHLPWAINLVVNTNSMSNQFSSVDYPINITKLQFGSTTLRNMSMLRKLIKKQFSGLQLLPHYESLMTYTGKYMKLLSLLDGRTTIRAWEMNQLAEKLDLEYATVRRYVIEGGVPEIRTYLERASEFKKVSEKIRNSLYIQSFEELNHLCKHLYLTKHLKKWVNFTALKRYVKQYFRFLDMLDEGYVHEHISKSLKVGLRTIYDWTQGRLPLLLHMLQEMPKEEPPIGWS